MSEIEFSNAQARSLNNSESFKVPIMEELREIKIGDLVKVIGNHERFWVIITGLLQKEDGDYIVGTIDSRLQETLKPNYRDEITCSVQSICQIWQEPTSKVESTL